MGVKVIFVTALFLRFSVRLVFGKSEGLSFLKGSRS